MKKIELLVAGDSSRTAFSAGVMNEIITALNALIAMEGAGGTKVFASDAKYVIYSSGSVSNTTISGSMGSGSYSSTISDVWL